MQRMEFQTRDGHSYTLIDYEREDDRRPVFNSHANQKLGQIDFYFDIEIFNDPSTARRIFLRLDRTAFEAFLSETGRDLNTDTQARLKLCSSYLKRLLERGIDPSSCHIDQLYVYDTDVLLYSLTQKERGELKSMATSGRV